MKKNYKNLILFSLVLLFIISCEVSGSEEGSNDLRFVQKWFCIISFGVSLVCGFTAIFARNDNTKTNAGIVGIVFLIVSIILLFSR